MTRTISERENFLRALEFRRPEWIPIRFDLLPAVWMRHRGLLRDMLLDHPLVLDADSVRRADFDSRGPLYTEGARYTDDWGCEWYNAHDGVLGRVVSHPLADWDALGALAVPDPAGQENWDAIRAGAEKQRAAGRLVIGWMSIVNGGLFDRLQFLRGLENLLIDLATGPPQLGKLIEIVLDYNMKAIGRWLDIGVDQLCFHGDIGSQNGLMMSPETFRKHLKPAYKQMFQACRQAGVHVHYSSDGNLLEIVDDLVECGATGHDPQVGACGIDAIAAAYNGKMCAMVDIDEQVLPFCTPADIDEQIRQIVAKVGSPEGGLMLYASPSADVPLANIEAICTAWERHCQCAGPPRP